MLLASQCKFMSSSLLKCFKVLPGQIATVWQTVLHFGDLELKTAANYSTISCPVDLDEATSAFDVVKVISRMENCEPNTEMRSYIRFFLHD